ncbi:2OG-Fe(II) oxygenase [Methylophilus aquaticus]|uniref:2OG-Fe(II) oxygenase n=1 Tax=Methylophilus aquaticus TaxID=1971610 RepID=A0ABT9JSM0_9PROT|nr:2OG-Fe(II) oxygenase [Methylophilus aquaticus]MDP8567530.1 2OG-Fe(II) oxygenase [Methylophilus aquaticus]
MNQLTDGLLPIVMADGFTLDSRLAREIGTLLAEDYAQAHPFAHAVIDGIFPTAVTRALLAHFPADPKAHDKVYEKGYGGTHKRQISPDDCDATLRAAFALFNSAPMLQFIEALTGFKGLLPDPYFGGGGLHETSRGGLLGIHADFQVNEGLQLYRRVNMLVYLNEDWLPEYGGNLELWDRQMQARQVSVAPLFNRCVIFNTDADSFHGHPDPLTTPEGITRKSIALYYYQALPIPNETGDSRHTLYVARPEDDAVTKAQVKKMMKKRNRRAQKMFGGSSSVLQRLRQWWHG